jgi:hypothetical protein
MLTVQQLNAIDLISAALSLYMWEAFKQAVLQPLRPWFIPL